MSRDQLLHWDIINQIIQTILGGAVADDHDPLAGIVAAEVIEKGLHARQGLVIALAIACALRSVSRSRGKRNMKAAGLFRVDLIARLLGQVAIIALAEAFILNYRPSVAKADLCRTIGTSEVRGEDSVEMVVLVPHTHFPRLLLAEGRQSHVVPARGKVGLVIESCAVCFKDESEWFGHRESISSILKLDYLFI